MSLVAQRKHGAIVYLWTGLEFKTGLERGNDARFLFSNQIDLLQFVRSTLQHGNSPSLLLIIKIVAEIADGVLSLHMMGCTDGSNNYLGFGRQ